MRLNALIKKDTSGTLASLFACVSVVFLAFLLQAPAVADEGQTGTLIIRIAGLTSSEGQVRVAVFNEEARWLKEPAYARVLEIENRACTWAIEDVPTGEYGIAVFHDENGNAKQDANFLGIPKEPYGFSNNARARFGPPKWEKARFAVSARNSDVEINVR